MCEPVTIAATALSVGSAISGAYGTRESAKAQFAANARQREAQNEEINAAASVRAGDRVKQSRAERARLRVAAGEAGVGGNSFAASLMDSAFQEDMDVATIGQNARFQDRASDARFRSVNASVRNPSALETGLQIGGAALQGYAVGKSLRIPPA